MKRSLSGALVAVSLGLSLGQVVTFTPALAQRSPHEISRREAIHMAKFSGVTRVRNVDRRGRYWVVLGETHRGRRLMNVRIDARSGRVVGMDRVR
jgi:hypothetical protein